MKDPGTNCRKEKKEEDEDKEERSTRLSEGGGPITQHGGASLSRPQRPPSARCSLVTFVWAAHVPGLEVASCLPRRECAAGVEEDRFVVVRNSEQPSSSPSLPESALLRVRLSEPRLLNFVSRARVPAPERGSAPQPLQHRFLCLSGQEAKMQTQGQRQLAFFVHQDTVQLPKATTKSYIVAVTE